MKNNLKEMNDKNTLRRKAEIISHQKELSPEAWASLSTEEIRSLVHELQVHQIELEMQNDELRQAQVEIDELRTRYFDLYNLAPVGYLVLNKQGNVLEANLTAANQVILDRVNLISYPMSLLIENSHRIIFGQSWKMLVDSGLFQRCEVKLRRKDDTVYWVRLDMSSGLDVTGTPSYHVVLTDITDRKNSEEALRSSEERYRMTLETMLEGCMIIGFDWTCLYINDTAIQHGRVQRQEILGKKLTALNPGSESTELVTHLRKCMEQRTTENFESSLTNTDGTVNWYEFSAQPTPEGIFVLSIDITIRKQTESLLKAAHSRLEQRIVERTADLQTANTALEKALRARDEFLAAVTHELRTPLTGILGLSEAMQLPGKDPLTEKQHGYLTLIQNSGKHLLTLVNDILDLSKLESGMFVLSLTPCSLGEICQASLQMAGALAVSKHLQSSLTMNPEHILLIADARQIKQILVNLIGNAIKFTPDGGSFGIEILGIPPVITKENPSAIGELQITVWDTGIGIKPEDLSRLFHSFVQLDASLSRQYNGTGLGLALVRRLTELQGGSVSVTSNVGAGSRFTVTLPWHLPLTS